MAYPAQPRAFRGQAQTWPCCSHSSGAPTSPCLTLHLCVTQNWST